MTSGHFHQKNVIDVFLYQTRRILLKPLKRFDQPYEDSKLLLLLADTTHYCSVCIQQLSS